MPKPAGKSRVMLRMSEIYARRFSDPDGRVRASFDIIWLSGWAPHESQPKPLRPGSAKAKSRGGGEADAEVGRVSRPWPVLQGPATIAKLANTALLSSEAVEQPVAAGAAEVALAATAIGPARGMR